MIVLRIEDVHHLFLCTFHEYFFHFWGVLNLRHFSLDACLDGFWFVLSVTPRVFIP